jgi:O-antigen ligase
VIYERRNIFENLFRHAAGIHPAWTFVFIILSAGAGFAAVFMDSGIYLLGGITGLFFIYLTILFPKVWIYLILLSMPLFLRVGEEGVTAIDAIMGIFYIVPLLLWLVVKFFLSRRELIKNTGDVIILVFFAFTIVWAGISVLGGAKASETISKTLLMLVLLLYFPISYYFSGEKDFRALIAVFIVANFISAFFHIYSYYLIVISGLEYAYQLAQGMRINQYVYSSGFILFFITYFYSRKFSHKMISFAMASVNLAALVITYSRVFWGAALLGGFGLFLFLNFKKKIEYLITLFVLSALILGGIFVMLGPNSKIFITLLENRFVSSSKGVQDDSMRQRLLEWEAVTDKIKESPIGGYGPGAKFKYRGLLEENTMETDIIHNHFLQFSFRYGIPMTLIFFVFLIIYTYKAFILSVNLKEGIFSAYTKGAFLILIGTFVINLVTNIYVMRDGILMTAFLIGVIRIAENHYNELKLKDGKK